MDAAASGGTAPVVAAGLGTATAGLGPTTWVGHTATAGLGPTTAGLGHTTAGLGTAPVVAAGLGPTTWVGHTATAGLGPGSGRRACAPRLEPVSAVAPEALP
ncbi:MAG: hypothetical protein M0020_04255, partial [Actinomycetota bacterium]|nr:hypothetical protein [Actinomycetota bacterium]